MTTREATKTYKLNQWTQIIRECRNSGQKVQDWYKENSVVPTPSQIVSSNDIVATISAKAIKFINKLFKVEQTLENESAKKRQKERLKQQSLNWRLFSGSLKGADASAGVYTLIETAKANGLNPTKYIEYILKDIPGSAFIEYPEFLEDYMPWDPLVQKFCK